MIAPIKIRELFRYTENDLMELLQGPYNEKKKEIDILLANRLLKRVKNNSSDEPTLEELSAPVAGTEKFLVFNYVGLIITSNNVIYCYPKYIKNVDNVSSEDFIQIMDVIRRHNLREFKFSFAQSSFEGSNVSFLAIVLELIRLYMEHGLYIKSEQVQEINGEGDINWERTFGETKAIVMRRTPFYPEMYTERIQWDELDFFHHLHSCIVSECYAYMHNNRELKELLHVRGGMKSVRRLKDFGSEESIVQKIKKEIASQFVTWKKMVLHLMMAYILRIAERSMRHSAMFYGTSSMNIVWEKACAAVLGNQLDCKIKDIQYLPAEKITDYPYKDDRLIDIIDKPKWIAADDGTKCGCEADTLIPDTVAINKNDSGTIQLVIYDAKYYNIKLTTKKVSGQPGIESITKQYLYHLAYKQFMGHFEIKQMENVFLFPTDDISSDIGYVTLPMLTLNGQLNDIRAVMLNAGIVWDMYLHGKESTLQELLEQDGRNDTEVI